MNLKGLLKNWFGYSRTERTGSFILAIICVIIVIISLIRRERSYLDEHNNLSEQVSSAIDSVNSHEQLITQSEAFYFDPNTVSHKDLLRLGLKERQASTLINYREAGATFKDTGDFRKIYGIDKYVQDKLIPWIKIEKATFEKKSKPILKPEHDKSGKEKGSVSYSLSDDLKELYFELNSADSIQLDSLPGIGKILGARIVKYRNLLGGYTSIEQLREVYGIDSMLVRSICKLVYADSSQIIKKNINKANYKELISHPYVTSKLCEDILYYRKIAGSIESMNDLIYNRIIDSAMAEKMAPYFSFSDSIAY